MSAFRPLIGLAAERALTAEEARLAFEALMTGEATPAQIGGFLMALRTRGETVTEIAAAAKVMIAKSRKVRAPSGAIDIVGTGGDGKHTLNISTGAAFVTAGAGVVVAKHGNRNLSSKSGTADVQSALGINVMSSPEVVERALNEVGIGFMMATVHHPAMAHVGPSRVELGTRTLFNLLGPLTNPAGVKRQLTGTFSAEIIRPMAETLRELGSEAAWLVHGGDGTDEMSITGPTALAELKDGQVTEREIHPEEAGLPVHAFADIIGGTPEENAVAFRHMLDGKKDAYRDAVIFNAAGALVVAGVASDLRSGAEQAAEAIDSGRAKDKLAGLVRLTAAA